MTFAKAASISILLSAAVCIALLSLPSAAQYAEPQLGPAQVQERGQPAHIIPASAEKDNPVITSEEVDAGTGKYHTFIESEAIVKVCSDIDGVEWCYDRRWLDYA